MSPDLPPRLAILYKELDGKGDVAFETLYQRVTGLEPPENVQQHLSSYVTRLNRRLPKQRVVPGERKRTYRLIAK